MSYAGEEINPSSAPFPSSPGGGAGGQITSPFIASSFSSPNRMAMSEDDAIERLEKSEHEKLELKKELARMSVQLHTQTEQYALARKHAENSEEHAKWLASKLGNGGGVNGNHFHQQQQQQQQFAHHPPPPSPTKLVSVSNKEMTTGTSSSYPPNITIPSTTTTIAATSSNPTTPILAPSPSPSPTNNNSSSNNAQGLKALLASSENQLRMAATELQSLRGQYNRVVGERDEMHRMTAELRQREKDYAAMMRGSDRQKRDAVSSLTSALGALMRAKKGIELEMDEQRRKEEGFGKEGEKRRQMASKQQQLEQKIWEYERQFVGLNSKVSTLERELADARSSADAVANQSSMTIDALSADLSASREHLTGLQTALQEEREISTALRKALNESRAQYDKLHTDFQSMVSDRRGGGGGGGASRSLSPLPRSSQLAAAASRQQDRASPLPPTSSARTAIGSPTLPPLPSPALNSSNNNGNASPPRFHAANNSEKEIMHAIEQQQQLVKRNEVLATQILTLQGKLRQVSELIIPSSERMGQLGRLLKSRTSDHEILVESLRAAAERERAAAIISSTNMEALQQFEKTTLQELENLRRDRSRLVTDLNAAKEALMLLKMEKEEGGFHNNNNNNNNGDDNQQHLVAAKEDRKKLMLAEEELKILRDRIISLDMEMQQERQQRQQLQRVLESASLQHPTSNLDSSPGGRMYTSSSSVATVVNPQGDPTLIHPRIREASPPSSSAESPQHPQIQSRNIIVGQSQRNVSPPPGPRYRVPSPPGPQNLPPGIVVANNINVSPRPQDQQRVSPPTNRNVQQQQRNNNNPSPPPYPRTPTFPVQQQQKKPQLQQQQQQQQVRLGGSPPPVRVINNNNNRGSPPPQQRIGGGPPPPVALPPGFSPRPNNGSPPPGLQNNILRAGSPLNNNNRPPQFIVNNNNNSNNSNFVRGHSPPPYPMGIRASPQQQQRLPGASPMPPYPMFQAPPNFMGGRTGGSPQPMRPFGF